MIITPDIQQQLHQKVSDGLYPSEQIAIEEAIKLLNQKDEYARFVNKAIEEAEQDVLAGDVVSSEELKSQMQEVKKQFLTNKI